MKAIPFWAAASFTLALATPGVAQQDGVMAHATFTNTNGEETGVATLEDTPHGVLITATIDGLPEGEHAFHIHTTGACAGPRFESAGGHFNPDQREHGFQTEGGPHAGDMPNVFVDDSGLLRVSLFNVNVTLGQGEGSLLDDDGAALVVHSAADDYRSQPAGAAGDRVACAVIKQADTR